MCYATSLSIWYFICLWGSVGRIVLHRNTSGKHLLAGAIHTGGAFRAKLLDVWTSNVRFLRISGGVWKASCWSWLLYPIGSKYTETLSAAFQWSIHLVGLSTMLLTSKSQHDHGQRRSRRAQSNTNSFTSPVQQTWQTWRMFESCTDNSFSSALERLSSPTGRPMPLSRAVSLAAHGRTCAF